MLQENIAALGGLDKAISAHGKVVHLRSAMSCFTRDYGKASSWKTKGWAPSKNTYSGWSKRGTRGSCPTRPQIVFELSFLPAGIILTLTFVVFPGINKTI